MHAHSVRSALELLPCSQHDAALAAIMEHLECSNVSAVFELRGGQLQAVVLKAAEPQISTPSDTKQKPDNASPSLGAFAPLRMCSIASLYCLMSCLHYTLIAFCHGFAANVISRLLICAAVAAPAQHTLQGSKDVRVGTHYSRSLGPRPPLGPPPAGPVPPPRPPPPQPPGCVI